MLEMFYKDTTYTNKIISLSDANERKNEIEWLSQINYQGSKKGAFATTIKKNEVLLAYAFVNDKILVSSSINKSEAFGVTKFLVLKTLLFGSFLLGFAVILGIYFSSSLTLPILKLTNFANKVAEGDFSSIVEINTNDEIKILGDTFNFMSFEIQGLLKNKEELYAKLEDYSKNLEHMVEQRTKELKEANDFMELMVNSLDQGLLVFDSELNCNPMFTKACEPIFGMSPLDKTLPDVLNITEEGSVQSLKQWARVVFNEMIPFESAVDLGPKEKITGKSYLDTDYKNVNMQYYPMRDAEEKISNIVLIATDITREVQATESAKEKEAYVSMILKILNNKTQFESFISEVEDIFQQFKKSFSVENQKIEFELCMMLFHTLNGGFGIYSMSKLQKMARDSETEIINVKDSNPSPRVYIPILVKQVVSLKQEFLKFRIELDKLVGTKFTSNQSFVELPRDKILGLKELVYQTSNKELQKYYMDNFLKVPIINYFKAYDELCKTTAAKLSKEFKGVTFHNPELKIEVEPYLEFFNVLVHLFRNCLDHGIEDPYTRKTAGKSTDGHIDVSFNEITNSDGKFLSVVIQDDGAGINPQVIRTKYLKLNPTADLSPINDNEIVNKIFDPFFSTRDEVSALSGRGVGMSAIKEVTDRLNGIIEIKSKVGSGTVFTFLLPEHELLYSR
jgi:two-component system chemotaxis sensor kinase CheA